MSTTSSYGSNLKVYPTRRSTVLALLSIAVILAISIPSLAHFERQNDLRVAAEWGQPRIGTVIKAGQPIAVGRYDTEVVKLDIRLHDDQSVQRLTVPAGDADATTYYLWHSQREKAWLGSPTPVRPTTNVPNSYTPWGEILTFFGMLLAMAAILTAYYRAWNRRRPQDTSSQPPATPIPAAIG
jgi:hypothetical protein